MRVLNVTFVGWQRGCPIHAFNACRLWWFHPTLCQSQWDLPTVMILLIRGIGPLLIRDYLWRKKLLLQTQNGRKPPVFEMFWIWDTDVQCIGCCVTDTRSFVKLFLGGKERRLPDEISGCQKQDMIHLCRLIGMEFSKWINMTHLVYFWILYGFVEKTSGKCFPTCPYFVPRRL